MTLMDAIRERHSVRSYTNQPIAAPVAAKMKTLIAACNRESSLTIQLILEEPDAFNGFMARYGKFENVRNYIALVGEKGKHLEEKCGYYGEKIVLEAQRMGLNTCWVAASFSKGKSKAVVNRGQKLLMVISVGYGQNSGVPHSNRPLSDLYQCEEPAPEWFRKGVEAAQLAPTAMNQQKFQFALDGTIVSAQSGKGFYTKTDLGIAKYHFEVGAGSDGWTWKQE